MLPCNEYVFIRSQTMDPRLRCPFCLQISGPSGSGKTMWVKKLLENLSLMLDRRVDKIIYCYGEYQPIFEEMRQSQPSIQFIEGFPDIKNMTDPSYHTLLVVDDLMTELEGNVELANIFSKLSHHRNCSLVFLQQSLYNKGKYSRLCSLNCHYIVLFKSPRDQTVIHTLARQMYPGCGKYLIEAYQDATQKPRSPLFIDLRPQTDDKFRLRSNQFPDEQQMVYVKKA